MSKATLGSAKISETLNATCSVDCLKRRSPISSATGSAEAAMATDCSGAALTPAFWACFYL